MKIEDERNLDYVDFLVRADVKINRWLRSASSCANGLQISSQSDEFWVDLTAYVDLLTYDIIKSIRWMNSLS